MPILRADGSVCTIAVRLDGVLRDRDGRVVRGAREAVRALHGRGYRVAVETNASDVAVAIWLRANGFPPLASAARFDSAAMHVDPRGFRFDGSFDSLLEFLEGVPGTWEAIERPGSEVPGSLPSDVG